MVDLLYDEIALSLEKNIPVSIRNFGTFTVNIIPEHKGYNVQQKKLVNVKEIRMVKFNSHSSFRKLVKLSKSKFTKKPQ